MSKWQRASSWNGFGKYNPTLFLNLSQEREYNSLTYVFDALICKRRDEL